MRRFGSRKYLLLGFLCDGAALCKQTSEPRRACGHWPGLFAPWSHCGIYCQEAEAIKALAGADGEYKAPVVYTEISQGGGEGKELGLSVTSETSNCAA